MKSIIDLIYYSDYFRTTDNNSLSDEYMSAVDRVCEAEKQLLTRLPECAEFLRVSGRANSCDFACAAI